MDGEVDVECGGSRRAGGGGAGRGKGPHAGHEAPCTCASWSASAAMCGNSLRHHGHISCCICYHVPWHCDLFACPSVVNTEGVCMVLHSNMHTWIGREEGWRSETRAPLGGGGTGGGGSTPPPPSPNVVEFLEAPNAPKKIFDWPKARKKIWPNLLGGGVQGGAGRDHPPPQVVASC